MKAKITLGFDAEIMGSPTGLSFFRDVHGVQGVYGRSEKDTKRKLKAALSDHLKLALAHYDQRYNRVVIGTGDNNVVVVQHNGWGFEYRIHGPDRKNGAAVVGDWKTFDEAMIAARKHAIDFGGVVWENRS
jgi:hypothetical protein